MSCRQELCDHWTGEGSVCTCVLLGCCDELTDCAMCDWALCPEHDGHINPCADGGWHHDGCELDCRACLIEAGADL